MTREEAIKTIQKFMGWFKSDSRIYKALEMTIQALSQEPTSEMVHVETLRQVMWERDIAIEQLHELGYEWGQKIEPCEDAISHDAVIEATHHCGDLQEVRGVVQQLPSVTQKCEKCAMNGSGSKYCDNCGQKSGKWILTIEDWNKWTCSKCGYVKRTDIHVNIGWEYCPNCGAKMESEET